jgi:hypothetical protein
VGATGVGLFYTTALGHGRRLAAHRGLGSGDLVQMMVGAVILWVVLRICWALAWGYAANGPRVVERPALTLMVVPASGRIRPS